MTESPKDADTGGSRSSSEDNPPSGSDKSPEKPIKRILREIRIRHVLGK